MPGQMYESMAKCLFEQYKKKHITTHNGKYDKDNINTSELNQIQVLVVKKLMDAIDEQKTDDIWKWIDDD